MDSWIHTSWEGSESAMLYRLRWGMHPRKRYKYEEVEEVIGEYFSNLKCLLGLMFVSPSSIGYSFFSGGTSASSLSPLVLFLGKGSINNTLYDLSFHDSNHCHRSLTLWVQDRVFFGGATRAGSMSSGSSVERWESEDGKPLMRRTASWVYSID